MESNNTKFNNINNTKPNNINIIGKNKIIDTMPYNEKGKPYF